MNIQAMRRAYINHNNYDPEPEISVKDEVIKLRKGIRKFAHDNNIACSFVSSKTSEIAESSINSLCKAYIKQDDLKFRVLSSPLKSEVLFYKSDDYPLIEPGVETTYFRPF